MSRIALQFARVVSQSGRKPAGFQKVALHINHTAAVSRSTEPEKGSIAKVLSLFEFEDLFDAELHNLVEASGILSLRGEFCDVKRVQDLLTTVVVCKDESLVLFFFDTAGVLFFFDTALIDLSPNETETVAKKMALEEINRQQQEKSGQERVALPIVMSVWFNAVSYVPSPHVTNFPESSLALGRESNDKDRVACCEADDQQQS